MTAQPKTDLSAIIVVDSRPHEMETVHRQYRDALQSAGQLEFIYALDGPNPTVKATLLALRNQGEPIRVLDLPRSFGGAACLREAVVLARSETLALLPPYLQIAPANLGEMLEALKDVDVVVARRDRCSDSAFNKARGRAFAFIAKIAGSRFSDLGCHVRLVRRAVFAELPLHDEFQIFLPLLAERAGFTVAELLVPQAEPDRQARFHTPGAYFNQLLDVASLAFLMRFLQKPFRFFGSLGAIMAALGVALALWMVAQRFFLGVAMGDRPLLTLSVLLIVVGVQIAIAGLVAEIVIFTRLENLETYRVADVIEADRKAPSLTVVRSGSGESRTERL
jgi:hypothetical protein